MEERMKKVVDEIISILNEIRDGNLQNDQKVLDWLDELNMLSITY